MDFKDIKRVSIFAGHYGSGKTNISINFAYELRKLGNLVEIADLDIVNPYFRTKDASDFLNNNGIRLISSVMANTNVDTPALPAEAYSLVEDKTKYAVIDVGGDDRGAYALGRYTPGIIKENNYDMFFVINKYRYLTKNATDTIEVMKEIEEAASLKFTAIVNNSNIGDMTTAKDVLESINYANEISDITKLPIKFTSVREKIYHELNSKINNLFPIKLLVKQSF